MKTIFHHPILSFPKYQSLHNRCLAFSLLPLSDHASSLSDSHDRHLSTPRSNLQPRLIKRIILRITHIPRPISHIIDTNPKIITRPRIPNPNPLPHLIIQRQRKTPHQRPRLPLQIIPRRHGLPAAISRQLRKLEDVDLGVAVEVIIADGLVGEFEGARTVGDIVEDGDEIVFGGKGGAVAGLGDFELEVVLGWNNGAKSCGGRGVGGGDAEEVLGAHEDAAGCIDGVGRMSEESKCDAEEWERVLKHFGCDG